MASKFGYSGTLPARLSNSLRCYDLPVLTARAATAGQVLLRRKDGERMSFDIVETPTLHAVATGDEQQLVEDLQERVEAAARAAEESAAVVEAAAAQDVAEQNLASLKKAERALNQFAKETGEK